MIRIIIILLFANLLFSNEIEEFDNILHVRPLNISRIYNECNECINTKFLVVNSIKTTKFNPSDTLTAIVAHDHYSNHYNLNINDITNDYLLCFNDNGNNDLISYFYSFVVGKHFRDVLEKDTIKLPHFTKTENTIFLIENKDSITNSFFPKQSFVKGRRINLLKSNYSNEFIDTNLFDYISLDLLEYYLDSLSQ